MYTTKLLFALLYFCVNCVNAASVWKVSKGENTIYIGGTVHVLSASDYPLPKAFDQAYNKSDSLVFETDGSQFNTPEFQQLSMQYILLKEGNTLRSLLSEDTYKMLQAHLQSRNLPIQNFSMFTPGFLTITLTMNELQILGVDSAGVDAYYEKLAQTDKKPISWFEEPEQQLAFIANIGNGNEDQIVAHTLRDISSLDEYMQNMMNAWRKGDRQKLIEVGILDMQINYPRVYQNLIVARNQDWIPKIEQLFLDSDVEFVLVGALHLVGKDGVLTKLSENGYQIEQISN
jgi:hypothetical protein